MRGGFGGGGEAVSLFLGRRDWEFIYYMDRPSGLFQCRFTNR